MKRARATALGALSALFVLLQPTEARAEYVENIQARDALAITLGVGGTAALALDVANVVYLAGGKGDETGRLVTGIGSIAAGIGIIVPSAMMLAIALDEAYVPYPGGGPEEDALHAGRAIAGVNIGLGVASIGLGIAALATYGAPEAESQSSATTARMWLLPHPVMASGGSGAGVSWGGGF
ncbi:MAG: hypothetical protein JRI23_12220 [Deltaproteobacteria bacterium]|jgi:hypothetical protein|nr:hypothetical protein [Deltaproteobacteria bacterium]MBW2532477.1 hypothetical protein [Deltaproteobacteria bacterium]